MVINSGSLSSTKGFQISAFFVEYWVMIKKHCSGFQGKAEGHRQYGDWLRASNGSKGGLEKQKAASSSGHEERMERMDEDSRNLVFPMNTNSVSLGTEQAGLSSSQSNHTSSQSTK